MRIMVTVLSGFAGLVLVLHAAIPLRLNELIGSGERTIEAVAWVGLASAWALATALASTASSVAVWVFAGAGATGLFVGASTDDRLLLMWGAVASGLALLTTLARREQRAADRLEWRREQRDVAVHLALRSLQETVPEILVRVPDGDYSSPIPDRPAPPHPIAATHAATVRRQADFARDA